MYVISLFYFYEGMGKSMHSDDKEMEKIWGELGEKRNIRIYYMKTIFNKNLKKYPFNMAIAPKNNFVTICGCLNT